MRFIFTNFRIYLDSVVGLGIRKMKQFYEHWKILFNSTESLYWNRYYSSCINELYNHFLYEATSSLKGQTVQHNVYGECRITRVYSFYEDELFCTTYSNLYRMDIKLRDLI